jgi:predicted transposase/invertase (TIGR01784 family)
MEHHLRMNPQELHIVINICIYTGEESPYPYSQDIYDCFEDVYLARETMFKPFKLLDLSIRSQEELLADGTLGAVEALLKQGKEGDYLNWINNNQVLICELISRYGSSIAIYILGIDNKNEPGELLEAMVKAVPENKDIIMSAAQKLQEEAKREGMQEGIQTGLIKGIKEGIEQGRELGIQTKAQSVAKDMLKEGFEISLTQKVTGLSEESIEKLERE